MTYVFTCRNVVPSSQPCWCCLQGHAAILHLAFVTFLSHFVFLSLTSHTALLKSNLNSGYCGSHACWNHFATSAMSPRWSSLRVWSVHHWQFLSVYEKSNNMQVCKCLGSYVFKWVYVWYAIQWSHLSACNLAPLVQTLAVSFRRTRCLLQRKVVFCVCNWEATSFHMVR